MRKLILIAIMAIPAIFASCSQEMEDIQEPVRKDIGRRETVTDLTRSLKEYDARFLIRQDENSTKVQARLPHITYSKLDMVKIALADVKGGLRGIGGGAAGVVVGAATSSLIKFGKMTFSKLLWATIKENIVTPHVYHSNDGCIYADSIGFYHNELEYAMYSSDRESYKKSSTELVAEANARMMLISGGYNREGGLPLPLQLSLASDIDRVREADDNLSYSEYCKWLKGLDPEDNEYLDFCAEYIYTAVYANFSDIDGYTDDVVYQIQHSNVDVQDKRTLYQGIQIAYASILYSKNMDFHNQ